MIGIYRIYHIISGKSYVGQSVDIKTRMSKHFGGTQSDMYIDRAIKKHGKVYFDWEILELCCENELDDRECHWISTLDCISPNGYNLKQGGANGRFSDEHKAKIGKANKGRKLSDKHRKLISDNQKGRIPWNKGKKLPPISDKHRARLSEVFTGRKHTETSRQKMRKPKSKESVAKRSGENHWLYGKSHKPETKLKISKTLKENAQKKHENPNQLTFLDQL